MDAVLRKILVPGNGNTSSKEVRDVARAILPSTEVTHKDVKEFVAQNLPEAGIFKMAGGSGTRYPKYRFLWVGLVSASEVARQAELLLFTATKKEFDATTRHVQWRREVAIEHPDITKAISGFAGARRVLVIRIRTGPTDSACTPDAAYAAAVAALHVAKECQSVAKISFVACPSGTGTLCVLAPGNNDCVIFDESEVDGEIKAKVGLPNKKILNWTYKVIGEGAQFSFRRIPLVTGARIERVELPAAITMYEDGAHDVFRACQAMERSTADFSVIGLVVDNMGMEYEPNKNQRNSERELKSFLKRVFEDDGFFFEA